MELLSGHEKIITQSGISLNAGTLNRGFTVLGTDVKEHVNGSKFKKLVAEGYTQWTDLHRNIRPESFTQMTGKGYNTYLAGECVYFTSECSSCN
jgi:hypothetical protein